MKTGGSIWVIISTLSKFCGNLNFKIIKSVHVLGWARSLVGLAGAREHSHFGLFIAISYFRSLGR